ncbi:MAG TPA: methyltransferase domain-containing protein [Terracidiphilus sp.]|nr:methyltransferase domain-containing protein [Terracidiphilus sp.]
MSTKVQGKRFPRFLAWIVASLFVLGFFLPPVGVWTGPVLGAWFVGTQRPWRGFEWMVALTFVPSLASNWRMFAVTSWSGAAETVGWMIVASLLMVLPFTFHRLVGARVSGPLSTLALPLGATASQWLALPLLPAGIFSAFSVSRIPLSSSTLLQVGAVFGVAALTFLTHWVAATLVWMWNLEFRRPRIAVSAGLLAAVLAFAAGLGLARQFAGAALPEALPAGTGLAWACLAGAIGLGGWALWRRDKQPHWAERPVIAALLRSPSTGEALHVESDSGQETLVSSSGERFPVRDGIPDFRRPEDLTGDNGKYNHLYEMIGGFYDDTQRVACALKGLDRDEYFLAYMRKLEVKAGDSVLETSVGTGLNLKYLPQGVQISGLDLSAEMLGSCQANLRRWGLEADLYLGNAEALPFADASFDVVFHVGGISFFNDPGKAIREMIRVARPGSLLLISDETEEYAQKTYERIPITSRYFKNRKRAVTIPVGLVPGDMEEVHVEMIKGGLFYALTFRKPGDRLLTRAQ